VEVDRRIRDIIERCEMTAAWAGIRITNLNQRNSLDDTPLHTVCTWGEIEPVKRLIAAGAPVNARGDRQCTPLFNAVIGRNAAVVSALIDAGANVSIRSSDGWSVVQYAKNVGAGAEVIAALESALPRKRPH